MVELCYQEQLMAMGLLFFLHCSSMVYLLTPVRPLHDGFELSLAYAVLSWSGSSDGLSPIAYAVLRDRSEIVNLLLTVPGTTLAPGMRLSSSTNETVLMRAVRVPFVNLALKLLQIVTPDEFSLRDHAGMNILHAAALSFDARIAEKVLVKAKEFGLLEKLMSQDSKAGSVMDAATSTKDDSVINLFRAIL
jgi:ankyrin repeat protein